MMHHTKSFSFWLSKNWLSKYSFILLGVFLNSFISAQTFIPTGISGGGALYAPAINPQNDKLFVTLDIGAFYTSINDGASWEMTNFNNFSPSTNSEIQFTSDENILYSIRFDGKLGSHFPMKSIDNGVTWESLVSDPSNGNCARLYTNPNSTTELIISDAETIYYSNDGGNSFSTSFTATGNQIPFYVAGCFWDDTYVYVGTDSGLLVSTNSGSSFVFDTTSGIPNGKNFFDFSGSKSGNITRLYGVVADNSSLNDTYLDDTDLTGNNEIIQCDYGITNWTQSFTASNVDFYYINSLPDDISIAYVSVFFDDSQGAAYGRLFKTENGGNTWTNKYLTGNNENIITGWAGEDTNFSYAWSANAKGIALKTSDPNFVMISDWGFISKSIDGGDNWQQLYVDQSTQNPANTLVDENQSYINNGLMITSCWNVTWFNQNEIFISYTDITGWRSKDGGNSWLNNDTNNEYNTTYQVINHPINNIKYAAVSEVHDLYTRYQLTDEYIESGGGALLFSTDNADSWSVLENFNLPVIDVAIDPSNPEIMYASVVHSNLGGIYITNNLSSGAAADWTLVAEAPRTEGHPFKINVLNDGSLVVSYSGRIINEEYTASSGVFYSTDQGATWQDRSHNDMFYWTKDVVVDPNDASQNTWYACVQDGFTPNTNEKSGIYRTTNRGQTWENILTDFNVESLTIDANNPDKMFVTTEFNGLLMCDNLSSSAPTFTLVTDYPFFHPIRVKYNPYNDNEIWVTSFGNGVYKADQTTLSISETSDNNIVVYPNPVKDIIHINGISSSNTILRFSIYEINGKLVCSERNHSLTQNNSLNVSFLQKGIYFIKIQTKKGNQTIKIIKTE